MSRAYAQLLLGIADAIVATDSQGRIVLWNDAAESVFGFARERVLGTDVRALVPQRFAEQFEEQFRSTLAQGASSTSRLIAIVNTADGDTKRVEAAISVVPFDDEPIIVSVVRDAGNSERQLREAEELAGMGSFQWNVGSDEITWSDNLARIYGYEPGAHPTTLAAFIERVHPDDRDAVQKQIGRALDEGASWSMEERIIRADTGETRILASEVRARRNAHGRVIRLCGICHDVTESRRAEEALAAAEARLRERTLHDPLTGLPNRSLLLDRLNSALGRAAREKTSVAVLLFDLDNFTLINDTVGHAAGDQLLRTMAARLVAAARTSDSAARVGGDEFVMICESVPDNDVIATARRISELLAVSHRVGSKELTITSSVGVAIGRGHETPEQLLRDADLALNQAKLRGKATIEIFDDTLRRHAFDRVAVEADLRRALQEGQIEPYYQPIVDVTTGEIVGFEALARWNHPDRGLLLPKHFLAVAEEAHLIGPLGAAMLREACAQLAIWQRNHPTLTMAVNLSLRQLDREFVALVEQTLRGYELDPRSLHVEVTESVLLDLHKSAAGYLNALASIGVQLGIDDFGTGYSSLLYLKRFPVRFLKIDRSFVEGLPESAEDAAIVGAVARLATSLGLSAIAEGVETAAQHDQLIRLGCRFAQGYYIAQPLSAADSTLALRNHLARQA